MSDSEIGALRAKLASRVRSDDYRQHRRDMDAGFLQYGIARDVTVEPVAANGVRAEWTSTPQDNRDTAILYLHGGGYVIGSLNSHRHLVSEAGRAARAWALALDYRLAPEHPFPAAVEDAVSGYRYLLSRGIRPGKIAIAGDSARRRARRRGDAGDPRGRVGAAGLRLVHFALGRHGRDRRDDVDQGRGRSDGAAGGHPRDGWTVSKRR